MQATTHVAFAVAAFLGVSQAPFAAQQPGSHRIWYTQEQLGLRLEPTRGPAPVLVIDHIERPTAN